MGTSSDLAVRHRGQTYYQHTSYDGHTENVLSQMAGTIAAMGVEALRARMDQEGAPMTEDNEPQDELYVDRKAMGNAYLLACQARGQAPYNLDYALSYEYGNPDFSHGGAIALLAPQIEWFVGFCNKIEDASVILDLDRGLLIVPAWNREIADGSYDDGSMAVLWQIDLTAIEGLDPQALALALQEADFDEDQEQDERRTLVDNVLQRVRDGQVVVPDREEHHYRGRGSGSRETFTPRLFFLRGLDEHVVWTQPIVDFLREMGGQRPVLAEYRSLLMTRPAPNEHELIVDLRTGDVETQNLVDELFEGVARAAGMVYLMEGEGQRRGVSMGSTFGSAGCGGDQAQWDAGLVPEDAVPMLTVVARDRAIGQVLEEGDEGHVRNELMMAILGFNEARWRKIEASGAKFNDNDMKQVVGQAVELARHFEKAVPGSAARRFERLSEGQRSSLLEHMMPVDRHVFTQLLGQPATKGRKPGL